MKKLFILILLGMPLAAMCQSGAKPMYVANYSSSFTMADPSYSETILTVWKDYENNTLDKHINLFADTVEMQMADGRLVKGRAENLAGAKEYRASLKSLKVTVDAFMSVKSLDKDENWVAIWGTEEATDKDGKQSTTRVHEIWGFNSAGKIAKMMQYGGM